MMRLKSIVNLKRCLLAVGAGLFVLGANGQEAKPPVMGWASWNNYHVNINEEIIRSQADAMAANGMKEAGYRFLNIDDGFFGGRDKKGRLMHHKQRFPHGMRALSDYIRKKGFVPGIYTDAGINTCGCHYDRDTISTGCGLYGHEREDLKKMMVEWNFDFIKVDWCGGQWAELNEREQYTKIGKIIRELKPQAVYNVCRWQFPGEWVTEIADSWRISGDIRDRFSSIMGIVDQNADLWPYCSPGHYNDMDMLQVGRGMSEEEDRTHFTMWCVMVSPLLAGNDLTQMSQQTLDILTNKELIAVNQDPLFLQARRVIDLGDQEVWAKRLASEEGKSRWAVVLLNRGKNMARMELPLSVTDISANGYTIRDLWLHKDLGANYNKTTTHEVPGHGVKAFILEGDTDGGIVSAFWHWNVPCTEADMESLQNMPCTPGDGKKNTDGQQTTTFLSQNIFVEGSWEKRFADETLKKEAGMLLLLQDKGIPVIWRPLHEAAGNTYADWNPQNKPMAWFWWGRDGASLLSSRATSCQSFKSCISIRKRIKI